MFLSIRWRAFAWAALIAFLVSHGTTAQRECANTKVEAAIVAAVRARMGNEAQVTLGECYVRGLDGTARSVSPTATLVALPDAGARTGGFVRFLVFDGSAPGGAPARRIGSVDVELHVSVPHARARRNLPPRTTLAADDVESTMGDVGRMPLAGLPEQASIVGARVVRPIPIGRPIVASMLMVTPLVRSGDEVRTVVRVGALEARGTAIAAQTGTLGEEIRVVNADSRRALKARVIGAGEVEVIHER